MPSASALIATDNSVIAADNQATHLHIVSFIAHLRPEKMAELKDWISRSGKLEIHAENAQGKLVLVTESNDEQAIVQLLDELRAQAGVLNAALVYHEQIALEDLAAEEHEL
jgi:nitrate reductase NapD